MDETMQQRNLTRGTDDIRINVNDSFELKYWAKKFGVTASEIKFAVEVAGDSPRAVVSQLENQKTSNEARPD